MRKFWLLCFLFCGIRLVAQEYLVQHYTTHDGLANDEVFCFTQDTSGVMWIGTDNGLSSFDGQVFRNYFLEDGLAGKSITSLLLDNSGQLYAGGYSKGISVREQHGIETTWKLVKKYKSGVDIFEFDGRLWETRGNSISLLDSAWTNDRYGLDEVIPLEFLRFFGIRSKS